MTEPTDKTITSTRKQVSEETIMDDALGAIRDHTRYRLEEKGWGTLASRHEALGIIAEEYDELLDEIRSGSLQSIRKELLDIATACHFAIACIDEKTMEW